MISTLAMFGLACDHAGPTGVIDDGTVEATLSDVMVTVVEVEWSTSAPATAIIEFGPDETYGLATRVSAAPAERHAASLLGLHPDTVYHYRVVATVDGETERGEDHTIETGSLPAHVPTFEILDGDDAWDGYIAASYIDMTAPNSGAVILDSSAEVVWYRQLPSGSCTYAELADDGTRILLRLDGLAGDSRVFSVSFDGREVEVFDTPDGHHALAQVPGIEFAYIASELGMVDGEQVAGDTIVELATDGSSRVVWNAWEQLEVERHEGWDQVEGFADWTHANGLSYDAEDDAYYLSLYWLATVLKIDRTTGETLWMLGGSHSDFSFEGVEPFGHAHAPEPTAKGLILFDNQAEGGSAVHEYALNETAWTATLAWSFQSPEGRSAVVLGDVDRFADGSILTGWGDIAEVRAVDADGATRWWAATDPGFVIGQVSRVPTLYP